MEEQEYIELNTLLAKLRVNCLKSINELDNIVEDEYIMRLRRREKQRNIYLVRNIDNIRKQMPLKVRKGTITVIK